MRIEEIMTRGLEYVTEEDNAVVAARKMRNVDIGALPVKNDSDLVTGIVTDRDIVLRTIAEGKDPAVTTVREVMTPQAVSCTSSQPVEDAVRLMEENQIRRLLVVDDGNNAVGMVTLGDVAVKSPGRELTGGAVEEISKPAAPKQ